MIFKKSEIIAIGEQILHRQKKTWFIFSIVSFSLSALIVIPYIVLCIIEGKILYNDASSSLPSVFSLLLPFAIVALILPKTLKRDTLLLGCRFVERKTKKEIDAKKLYELFKKNEVANIYVPSNPKPVNKQTPKEHIEDDNHHFDDILTDEMFDDLMDD